MNTNVIHRNIDNLKNGINEIISKNRCSLLDSEKILLEECIKALDEAKQKENQNTKIIFYSGIILKVTELLLQYLTN